ncbi:probable 2-oxoglutarate-dependent dioxygenase AOP1 [Andrographis paniculata]|uniref:probable 2-oxoglutarate-dependent dioxygenase AOP1 n=1 Tax=Andrographis paniculata TaxID=175694 RepID=UPI0021E7A259|nr:probable 2-oxoglutarate-dependent dioxygenase AOP1 [Andrographis paniculata]
MGSLTAPAATLPTIEIPGENSGPGSPAWSSTAEAVVAALEQYGCFLANLSNFSSKVHSAIFHASEELFSLPTHVKTLNVLPTPSHGYVGQIPVVPLYEALGIENPTNHQDVKKFIDLLWPSGNDHFGEAALKFSRAMVPLDQVVMRMLADKYGVEESYKTLKGATYYLLRFIKYLAPRDKEEDEIGIIPHTDKSFLSILHQRQVKGLEVRTKDGEWIGVDPGSPSTFVVMAGDAIMGWSNGRIESCCHRVIMRGSEERYSLGFFTFIKDVKIHVPEELIDADHPLQFKPFDNFELIHFYYTEEGKKSKCPIRAFCGV